MYRQSEKKLLNSNISSTCPHNMTNFGPLTAGIGSVVWGTPANFKGFRVLPSLLQRRHSPEANQTLHDVWPYPALVHYIYIHFRGLWPPDGILSGAKFTLRSSLAFSYIGSITARRSSAKLCGVVQGMKLECSQLTYQFPTGQSPAWSSSDRRNYDSRERATYRRRG